MSSVMRLCLLTVLLPPALAPAAAPPLTSTKASAKAGVLRLVLLNEEAEDFFSELRQLNGCISRMLERYDLARQLAQALAEERDEAEGSEQSLAPKDGNCDVVFINQQRFTIPIRVVPERQHEVRELKLFMSRDKGKTWDVYTRAKPSEKGFDFYTDDDGLYYFTIAVVDHKGRQDPPNVSRAPVGQKIWIDTKSPELDLTAERSGSEVELTFAMREEHPERESVKLEYRVGDSPEGEWTPLPVVFSPRGVTRFQPSGRGPVTVRLSMRDQAGNEPSVERSVPASKDAGAARKKDAAPTRGPLPPLQIVNNRRVTLDFDVAQFGPSGLGGVDVYVTTDEGATWEKSQADPNVTLAEKHGRAAAHGSVTVDLPKDELSYGFYLVVKSRAGLGKEPPRPGSPPQVRVECDTALPTAELYAPQSDCVRPDCLILTWLASDRNLADNPISIEWATHPDGPWTFIGDAKLANSGRFTWQIAEETPAKVYLRLSVRDTAGNVAVAQTPQPVLIDLKRPVVENVRIRK